MQQRPDWNLPENSKRNLHRKLDKAIEETFPTSDPVSVTITKGEAVDYGEESQPPAKNGAVRRSIRQRTPFGRRPGRRIRPMSRAGAMSSAREAVIRKRSDIIAREATRSWLMPANGRS